jgi:hypothetical protein
MDYICNEPYHDDIVQNVAYPYNIRVKKQTMAIPLDQRNIIQ